jgi:hypothetical protein
MTETITLTSVPIEGFNPQPLLDVKNHILEVPTRLMMSDWVCKANPGEVTWDDGIRYNIPECGTVACAAGWIKELELLRVEKKFGKGSTEAENIANAGSSYLAMRLLNLKITDMFHVSDWPLELYKRWKNAETMYERSYIFADVVDDFVKICSTGESDYGWPNIY